MLNAIYKLRITVTKSRFKLLKSNLYPNEVKYFYYIFNVVYSELL